MRNDDDFAVNAGDCSQEESNKPEYFHIRSRENSGRHPIAATIVESNVHADVICEDRVPKYYQKDLITYFASLSLDNKFSIKAFLERPMDFMNVN